MEWALVTTSVALVAATVGLALYTKQLATEAQNTRLLAVRPRLALDVRMRSGVLGEISVINIGPGAAIRIDTTLSFDPIGDERPWRAHVLAASDSRQFWPPTLGDTEFPSMEELADVRVIARLRGSMEDVYGDAHTVDEEIDLARWWRLATEAKQRLISEPVVEIAEALTGMRKSIDEFAKREGQT